MASFPPPARPRPAVQYLRRSTSLQACSLEHQAQVIASYAAARGYRIVGAYADDQSGLDLAGRPGLRALLAAALGPSPGFSTILVYDVSRWGRFQDLDQGAHYEFLCRKAGIAVEYCAEPFDNDGTPEANLIKQIKRSMAAEYSRALSDRIAAAKRLLASKGFVQSNGGVYGLRRLAIDASGRPRAVLERGEHKVASGFRTVLTLGPPQEVATVRRIFRLYVVTGLKPAAIAAALIAEGVPAGPSRAWTAAGVRRILRNEVYVGVSVFGRTMTRLKRPIVHLPPDTWIRLEGAFPPIIERARFEAAQQLLTERRGRSDAQMLDELKSLLEARGRIDSGLIDEAIGMLSASSYNGRFGGLRRAYALIGYSKARRRSLRTPRRQSGVSPEHPDARARD